MTPFHQGSVKGFLHEAVDPSGRGVVLTHGAGANCNSPLLIDLSNALAAAGAHVLRCDLPFRQKRPFGPPPPSAGTEDRAGLREAVAVMKKLVAGPVTLGGHSYGGRQATLLASETPDLCAALVLFSYPLHPPDKPAQLRTGHFPNLQIPALFVHGTKDPFGSIEEMRQAIQLIPATTELLIVDRAGHDLLKGKFDPEHLILRLSTIHLCTD